MTSSRPTPEWSARVREAFHRAGLAGLTGHARTALALHLTTCNKSMCTECDSIKKGWWCGMGITEDRNDPELTIIDPENGQQMAYLVLSEEERAQGFVQPVRLSYIHEKCGAVTTMNRAIAETYARNPRYYGGTYCVRCQNHFPVGALGEFVWDGTDIKVGTFAPTGD